MRRADLLDFLYEAVDAQLHPWTIPSAFARKMRSALSRSCALNSFPNSSV